jgi:hypothetical protein
MKLKTAEEVMVWMYFALFSMLYMLDGYISTQFIAININYELNPFVRVMIKISDTIFILYLIKISALMTTGVAVYIGVKHYTRAIFSLLMAGILILMVVNMSSLCVLRSLHDNGEHIPLFETSEPLPDKWSACPQATPS